MSFVTGIQELIPVIFPAFPEIPAARHPDIPDDEFSIKYN